jgi:hypothetical protein
MEKNKKMPDIDFVTEKGIISGYAEGTELTGKKYKSVWAGNPYMIGPELTGEKYKSVMSKALGHSRGTYNDFDISNVGNWVEHLEERYKSVSFFPSRMSSVALFVKASPSEMLSIFEEAFLVNFGESLPDDCRILDRLPADSSDFEDISLKSLCNRRKPAYLYFWWD